MIKILIFSFVCLAIILFLRQSRPELAMLAAAAAGVMMLFYIIKQIYTPVKDLLQILTDYGINSELISYLLKSLGICFLTKFSAELCADFGQSSLSGKVEMAGKAALFILSFPLIKDILNTGLSLL